jgi:2-dehydropantoate 2-reductase
MMKRIGVIGVGGVGGYFGGKLCRLAETDPALEVFFMARGAHLEAIRKNGLELSTAEEGEFRCVPTLATDDLSKLPALDLCLLCVKAYDLTSLLPLLGRRISPDTLIVPLSNGVDIPERIRAVIHQGVVLPACLYIGTHIERPGRVEQNGGARTVILGPDPLHESHKTKEALDIFARASIRFQWEMDPYPMIWEKFIFIAGYGLVTAWCGKTLGEVFESVELRGMALAIMREIASLAEKRGVRLPPGIAEDSLAKAAGFPPGTRTSFQRDFENPDKPDERDLFGGTTIRLGESLGVETPATRAISVELQKKKPVS